MNVKQVKHTSRRDLEKLEYSKMGDSFVLSYTNTINKVVKGKGVKRLYDNTLTKNFYKIRLRYKRLKVLVSLYEDKI